MSIPSLLELDPMMREKIAEEGFGKFKGLVGIMAHNALVGFEEK